MASVNPFDLLDDDAEDLNQLVAKPLKVEKAAPVQSAKFPTKPAPPSQAVKEGKNAPRGGDVRRGGSNRGRGSGYNRESRNNDAPPANGNGYGGGYGRSEDGDGARRGGPAGGRFGRGGRRGGFSNGDSGDFEHPRRNRHSGTGQGNEFKRDGAGRGNWGTTEDEITPVTEESTTVVEKNLAVEKLGGEDEANKDTPVKEKAEEEPEDKSMTLEEYEKVLEEKRQALQATKVEERKVDTKAFETMQQISSKKSNNDDVFIKLGTEKDKRTTEKEEKTKKSLSINEFLKPADGERTYWRGGYRSERVRSEREGRGDQGPRGGRGDHGPRGGRGDHGPRGGAVGVGRGKPRHEEAAAPAIGDTALFPTLGK
ncbi:hypothetical protein EUTSA_v10025512mg [Eutrema salsugineum]|uniref:Hyaluronan/mRNA-binding protein domain-containing protein n=1 Tax=Eutrema salsugineum TaxID=72664 RepID=V4MJS1_EUTSA|nr:RGG repeats nuclear RNA binding protein B [Eutrema salsugineum]ESQ55672.1 hypothetical protein EUTSA_v10025512mg [Eutrema salsugineum]